MLNIANDIAQTTPGSGNTPFGEYKNDAVPGDNSGTPLIEKWPNDIYYALYAVLNRAGITPSGTKENVSVSQFLTALLTVIDQENPANFLRPSPQDTPNNTVKLSGGVTRDPNNNIGEPVIMAAGLADAITHTAVTISGEGRFDRLVHDKLGNVTKKIGVQDIAPVKPALVVGENPICSVLVTSFGAAPVIDNTLDIIIDERPQNNLQFLNNIATDAGQTLLIGRINLNGTINLSENFGNGTGFSVVKSSAGVYEITLTGFSAFTEVFIESQFRGNASGNYQNCKGVTDINLDTGFGTPTGCRIVTVSLDDLTGGGPGIYTEVRKDLDFSFIVQGIN